MEIKKDQLISFLKAIYHLYGHDFVEYQMSTLKRRIENHAISVRIDSFEQYAQYVLSNKANFEKMFKYFSINVTEFFREPKQLKILKEKVLPYLSSYAHIKIWYAGCSSGEQVYSLAFILEELGLLHKTQIYATDFNNEVLETAHNAIYNLEASKICDQNYKEYGGMKNIDHFFHSNNYYLKVKDYYKKNILFFNHNLVTDKCMNEFQLIICTNVLIYFNDSLKHKVIRLFDESLRANGFLVIGQNEFLNENALINFKEYIYNKGVYQKWI